jgi:hypothetical protein
LLRPLRSRAHDLAIDHGVMCLDRVREFLTELRPVLEGVPVAGTQRAVMAGDVSQRAEAVVLDLE